jgi:hypothetical protein
MEKTFISSTHVRTTTGREGFAVRISVNVAKGSLGLCQSMSRRPGEGVWDKSTALVNGATEQFLPASDRT